MECIIILTSAIAGTTAMTLFSYVYSTWRSQNFKEPELLNEWMIHLNILEYQTSKNHVLGWLIHYAVGFIFITVYHITWGMFALQPSVTSYLIAGVISGIIGIVVWRFVMKKFDLLPQKAQPEYFFQLEIAHIIFALVAYVIYTLSNS